MNWAQIINTLVFVFGTFVSVLEAIHLSKHLTQRLSEHTTIKLEQFASMAVRQVEQTSLSMPSAAKKRLAQAQIIELFQSYRLPIPSPLVVEIALESAVFMLPKE